MTTTSLDGGDGDDVIFGMLGNDNIRGGGDDDNLIGNEGDDDIEGGDGKDVILGDIGEINRAPDPVGSTLASPISTSRSSSAYRLDRRRPATPTCPATATPTSSTARRAPTSSRAAAGDDELHGNAGRRHHVR